MGFAQDHYPIHYTIVHPSRGRPKKSLETYQKWFRDTGYRFVLSLDQDDPCVPEYIDLYPDRFKLDKETKWNDWYIITINKNRSAIDAINNGSKYFHGNFLIVVSDDTEPHPYFESEIYKATGNRKNWILKTYDGIQPYLITMPIVDQDGYNTLLKLQGGLYHPDFLHLFADTYLTCLSDIHGIKIDSSILFKHNHYSVNGTPPDELHKINDATWKQGEETFIRLMKQFTPDQRKKITDPSMRNWLRNKGVK